MIDFRLFSGAFLTPLCPGDGFASILVREVATLPSRHYSIILRKLNTYTQNEKILRSRPWVLANPGPHDEENASPDQGELDEEGVEVGGRLRDNVTHQVDSTTCEVVKLFHWGHLEAKHYHLYLQII